MIRTVHSTEKKDIILMCCKPFKYIHIFVHTTAKCAPKMLFLNFPESILIYFSIKKYKF